MNVCSVVDCFRNVFGYGYCEKHYYRFKKWGDPLKTKNFKNHNGICSIENCNEKFYSKGYCQFHKQQIDKKGKISPKKIRLPHSDYCKIDGCNNPYRAKGYCNTHYVQKTTKEHRRIIINHYSNGENICNCCGESIYEFLTIDHINNDGAEHRRKIGLGSRIYLWIIKNNFPKEFQILCYNCNCARFRTKDKKCPHEHRNP